MAGNQIAADFEVLMAKVESTYGTDPTPDEGVDVRGDINIDLSAVRSVIERQRVWAKQSRVAHAVINEHIPFSFSVAVGGVEDVDNGTPGVHPFLVGGGCAATLSGTSAGGDVEAAYAPTTEGKGSFAMYYYFIDRTSGQQMRLKLLGCRNNWELVAGMGSELLLNVTGQSLYAEVEAAASLTNPSSYSFGVPSFMVTDVTHTMGGTARRITNWNLSPNWQVAREDSITGSANGQEITLHRDRGTPAGGSVNPVALSTDFAASNSYIQDARDADEIAHALSFNDGTRTFAYAAPKIQIGSPSIVKDNAFRRFDTPYMANLSSAGDDEFSLTFGLV